MVFVIMFKNALPLFLSVENLLAAKREQLWLGGIFLRQREIPTN